VVAHGAQRVGFHLERVIAAVRAVGRHAHARDLGRDGAGLFVGEGASRLVLDLRGAELLHVRERDVVQGGDRDAVARLGVGLDADLGPGGEGGGAGRVVHAREHLREIDLIGVAQPELRHRAVGHHVRRLAALGDDALDPCLRSQCPADGVDVVEQLDHAGERIASVPGLQLMRRRARKDVAHHVDVHAAAPEPRPRGLGGGGGV
jgi:hypothetical protein